MYTYIHILFKCIISPSEKTYTNNLAEVGGIHLMWYTHLTIFVKTNKGREN